MSETNFKTETNRLVALDCFRGLAILLMVLSGSIAFGDVLPAWMYHAQVPPPTHTFNPTIAGITWVDLVFPFFLFSMGAAFPLALDKKLNKNDLTLTLVQVIKRYILLLFFAVFIHHAKAWVMSPKAGIVENILSIGCFLLLFLMFSKTNFEDKIISIGRQVLGFALAITFLWKHPFNGQGFDIYKSDIIIIVLANMALFGSLIWIFTKDKHWLRLAVLPLLMGMFLSGKIADSWTSTVFNWSPLPWAYTFYYLKYLFIIIPGTFAGDWLLKAKKDGIILTPDKITLIIAILCILLVCFNTVFLFIRQVNFNLLFTTFTSLIILFLTSKIRLPSLYLNFVYSAIFLLFLGLIFEPFEGGIKKDPSTYSYYFVCSGMAFLTLFGFILFENGGHFKSAFKGLAQVGQNPMIAYTAGSLFLMPLLKITELETQLNLLNSSAWGGFLKGVIFTTIVAIFAWFFTKKRIFWKT